MIAQAIVKKTTSAGVVTLTILSLLILIFALPLVGLGQSDSTTDSAQMEADMKFCKEHAKTSSGYDPENPDASVSDTSRRDQRKDTRRAGLRGAAKGAAKGAIVGGVVESVGDDSHDDATEIGAATGAVTSGLRSRRQAKKQAETQEDQAISEGSAAYTNLYNECMQNRGY